MKKTWLETLKGLAVSEAEDKVKEAGLACNLLNKGDFRIMLAVANTVFLYLDEGKVAYAEAGDGLEIE